MNPNFNFGFPHNGNPPPPPQQNANVQQQQMMMMQMQMQQQQYQFQQQFQQQNQQLMSQQPFVAGPSTVFKPNQPLPSSLPRENELSVDPTIALELKSKKWAQLNSKRCFIKSVCSNFLKNIFCSGTLTRKNLVVK